ncbi:hypothetical protein FACS1894182_00980 [Bacteroidia bacterium]|nr:hypothetical protein FACS1894182_00980 [Bacteroidia bacterium]
MAQGSNADFITCQNGHHYPKTMGQCPYCPKGNAQAGQETRGYDAPTGSGYANSSKTEIYEQDGPTIDYGNNATTPGGTKNNPPQNPVPPRNNGQPFDPNKTGFGDYDPFNQPTGHSDDLNAEQPQVRYTRRLVGVLFTNNIDKMGVVFNLFEGKNLIGRNDANCNIKVLTDTMMSSKHALLLNRGESFILRDEMSSHGTFVNDEDIATEPYTLKDGDVIRMGNTRFLFRSFI